MKLEKDPKFLLQFFNEQHLSPFLQGIVKPFSECADIIANESQSKDDKHSALEYLHEVVNLPTNLESNACFLKIYQATLGVKGVKPLHDYDIVRLILEAKDCAVRSFTCKVNFDGLNILEFVPLQFESE